MQVKYSSFITIYTSTLFNLSNLRLASVFRIGDITPSDCVPPEVKKDIEEKAMVELG